MANSDETYNAIKNLENDNVLSLSRDSATVLAGTFDAETGGFHYAVPTMLVTEPSNPDEADQHPAEPGAGDHGTGTGHHPKQPVQYWAGVITTNAVDLKLQFELANADPGFGFRFRVGLFPWTTIPAGQTSATVDAGSWTSTLTNGQPDTLTISWQLSDHVATASLVILRPPTFGAFTIPALPLAVIYAPPPGPEGKNYAEYTSTDSSSTKVSTSVGSDNTSTTHKTATAYTTNDFLGKITGLLDGISKFGTSFAHDQSSAAVHAIGAWTAGLDLASQIIQAFVPDESSSDSHAVTTTDDHDLLTTDTESLTNGTPLGAGPGAGDRIVYLRNVRVAWLIADGLLDFTVLGNDGTRTPTGKELLDDAHALGPTVLGGVMAPPELAARVSPFPTVGPNTNLDAGSLRMLIYLDPFILNQSPVLAEPRFAPNDNPTIGGGATDPNGDVLTISHEVSSTDTTTSTTVDLHISDYKPGWLVGLFGDDQAREDQLSSTFTRAKSTTQDETVTASVHVFVGPDDPPYLFGVYYDRLSRTLALTDLPHGVFRPGPVTDLSHHHPTAGE